MVIIAYADNIHNHFDVYPIAAIKFPWLSLDSFA